MTLDPNVAQALTGVSTATLTTDLRRHGVHRTWMRGARPLQPDQPRVVGRAFTMRFVPAREDLVGPNAPAPQSIVEAIDELPADAVVVVDANGIADAGVFGDILCTRMRVRGVAALVLDGPVRDRGGVLRSRLPVWCDGVAAPPYMASLAFAGTQQPIGCGGVAVIPDDVVVADGDGAVVIPAALVDEITRQAVEHERLEEWIMAEVDAGARLPGLYPPNEEHRARYEAAMRAREGRAGR